MTDKPTPEQIQRACDLANAPNDALLWHTGHYGVTTIVTALADTIAKLDAKDAMVDGQAALIATLTAERDKARADLGEIYIQLDGVSGLHRLADDSRQAIEAAHDTAAPYRVETDPLVEALVAANARLCDSEEGYAPILRAELAKRGLEIGRAA